MTVIADAKKRVVLPTAKPGDRFDLQLAGEKVVLTRLEPARPIVAYKRKGGLLLATSETSITWEQTRKAMDEFP